MGYHLVPPAAAFLSLALLAQASLCPAALAQESPAYLALGDSLAFGVGASNASTTGYVARAHEALGGSDRYRELGLDLVNVGVAGATSADLVAEGGQLDAAISQITSRRDTDSADDDVEVITVDIGGNDLLTLVAPGSPCLESASVEPCRAAFGDVLSAIQRNLSDALTRLREAAPEAVLVVVDLYNPYSGTGDLREPIAEIGVGQANGVISAVTANPDLGVRTASIFQLFGGRGGQWIAPDGIHPNDSGHAVIAEAVIAAISGREPVIPDELLAVSPGATAQPADVATDAGTKGTNDGVSEALFAAAIAVAFAAGIAISGVYFLARGRYRL
jgi:lysophospholipase L1-like esterase